MRIAARRFSTSRTCVETQAAASLEHRMCLIRTHVNHVAHTTSRLLGTHCSRGAQKLMEIDRFTASSQLKRDKLVVWLTQNRGTAREKDAFRGERGDQRDNNAVAHERQMKHMDNEERMDRDGEAHRQRRVGRSRSPRRAFGSVFVAAPHTLATPGCRPPSKACAGIGVNGRAESCLAADPDPLLASGAGARLHPHPGAASPGGADPPRRRNCHLSACRGGPSPPS
ncbi:hypothetical protein NDU88_006620 [Pleurodeles waltl]|uniref:Uncharacterized protein n=1 Tax=Pleurodeles waltl TaxID=8319 RepID=A0AAV7MHY0_PLEWA|nr:hypothetical protein NDU88_006620 [Pleurodeles waltl]